MLRKLVILLVMLVGPEIGQVMACKTGFEPSDTPGVCQEKADTGPSPDQSKWVSDEKPPKDKMPSYQREGVKAVDAPPGVEASSDVAHDYQAEREQR